MKISKISLLKYGVLIAVIALLSTLFFKNEKPAGQPRDYAQIAAEGILRVATEYNSISFFVDGDSTAGFHYELIEAFARNRGWKTTILPEMSVDKKFEGLAEGKYDIIAYSIPVISELKDSLALTTPIVLNKQVLVQRKATSPNDSAFIKTQLELAGKTIHVVKSSPAIQRIRHLSAEIGDTIYIKEVEKYGSEQLISLVAHGDIDYAVCDESIARAAADSLPQIDANTAISFTQFYSWAVSKQSPALLDSLNAWIQSFRESAAYSKIHKKYYTD